jgi:hypothetical protein
VGSTRNNELGDKLSIITSWWFLLHPEMIFNLFELFFDQNSWYEPGFSLDISLYGSVCVLRSVGVRKLPQSQNISSAHTLTRFDEVNSKTRSIFQNVQDHGAMHDRLRSSRGNNQARNSKIVSKMASEDVLVVVLRGYLLF